MENRPSIHYEPEAPEQHDEEIIELSPDKVQRLFFLSFYVSQGLVARQQLLFQWLHYTYPQYRIPSQTIDAVKAPLLTRIARHVGAANPSGETSEVENKRSLEHQDQAGSSIVDTATELLRRFEAEFQKPLSDDKADRAEILTLIMRRLTRDIITADSKWLVEKGGRPRSSEGTSPMRDPQLSQICAHGFLGKPTGSEEYDTFFRQAAEYLRTNYDRLGPYREALDAVIERHNATHPNERVVIAPSNTAHNSQNE